MNCPSVLHKWTWPTEKLISFSLSPSIGHTCTDVSFNWWTENASSLFTMKQLPKEMAFERGNKFMSITCVMQNNIWIFWKVKFTRICELSVYLVSEKFCCRVIECIIKVIYLKHYFPVTQGSHRANGTQEIMTLRPRWICNFGKPHWCPLFLPQRIRRWTNKTNVRVEHFSVYEHSQQQQPMLEIHYIFWKLFSREKIIVIH